MVNDRPTMLNLGHWLRYRARSAPNSLAVRDAEESLRYSDLAERVEQARETLAAEGLAEGAVVGCALPPSVDAVVALYATWDLGAIAAPIEPGSVGAEMDFCVREPLPVGGGGRPAQGPGARTSASGPAEIATRIRTSGSEGPPGSVDLSHANHIWSAVGSAANLGSSTEDEWLCCLPLNHVSGLAQVQRALLGGGSVTLYPDFDAERISAALSGSEGALLSVVATQLQRLVDADAKLSGARAILAGGGPVPEDLVDAASGLGGRVLRTYGLTEAGSQVATVPPARAAEAGPRCGPVLPTAEVRITDGRIDVRGPTVATRSADQDGWLRTGDLGSLDGEGWLTVIGRADDVIVTGGENVSPLEVENALSSHPAVSEVVVFGLPDSEWQTSVNAALVLAEGCEMPSVEELRLHCGETLARHEVPKRFVPVSDFPRTASGKPLRRALAERIAAEGR